MIAEGGDVVMFANKGEGTVVSTKGITNYDVGHYDTCWAMDCFKPFHGTIELTQE